MLLLYSDISELELIYQRSLVAFISVALILYISGESVFEVDKEIMKYAFIRIFGSALGYIFLVFSLEMIAISKTVVIVYNPFFASFISYMLIGEQMTNHDLFSFLLCTIGVICLTNPFSDRIHDLREWIGILSAVASSVSYNVSYVALRKIKDKPVNSWILVFFIMVLNLIFMPSMIFTYDAYRETYTHYTDKVWIIVLLLGALTLSTLYFTNLMFYYEKAGRGTAYHNFELIYTYFFDVASMKTGFYFSELAGAGLIVLANIYLFIVKSFGIIN